MRLLKRLLSLMLILTIMVSAVSCGDKNNGDKNNGDSGKNENPNSYSVTVLNPFGKPLSDVTVYVHRDGEGDYNICTFPVNTDANGKATFTLDPNYSYSVQLANVPEAYTCLSGYTRSERYAFDSNNITVKLESNDGFVPEMYSVGDPIANFTLYDVDGNRYELYELLKSKKVVVLNFWFYNCGPCQAEFPALNGAYIAYKDSVEVLAINDYPNETVEHVKSYESKIGLNLDMPLFKAEYGSDVSLARFPSNGYPTTVVIDSYGTISFIHVGSVTSMAKWKDLFAHYTSESYDGTPFNF